MWLEGLRHGLEVNRLTDCMQEGGQSHKEKAEQ